MGTYLHMYLYSIFFIQLSGCVYVCMYDSLTHTELCACAQPPFKANSASLFRCVCLHFSISCVTVCVRTCEPVWKSERRLFFFFPLCMKIIESHVSWTGATSLFFAKRLPWELKHKAAHPTKIPAGIVFLKGERTPLRKTKTFMQMTHAKTVQSFFTAQLRREPISGPHVNRGAST